MKVAASDCVQFLTEITLSLLLVLIGLQTSEAQGVQLVFLGENVANHGFLTRGPIGTTEYDTVMCVTSNAACCSSNETEDGELGNWFFPNGSSVQGSGAGTQFYRTRGPQVVRLHRRRGGVPGIYHCRIPDARGEDQDLYVGLYTIISGQPDITSIQFTLISELNAQTPIFSLTCISEGGPVEKGDWLIGGTALQDGSTYDISGPTVVDTELAIYHHTLTVSGRWPDMYQCRVLSVRPQHSHRATMNIEVVAANPPTVISAEHVGNTTVRVIWTPPTGGATVIGYRIYYTGGSRDVGNGSATEDTFTLQYGTYIITMVALSQHIPSALSNSATVTVETLDVSIAAAPHGAGVNNNEYRAASTLTLTCQVQGANGSVTYNWQSRMPSLENDKRHRDTLRSTDDGTHTCTATDQSGITGGASVELNVIGIGLFVIAGDVDGDGISNREAVLNNSLVISGTTGNRFQLQCYSESTQNNVGNFIGLDGSSINNIASDPFDVTRRNPAGIRIRNDVGMERSLRANEQGVYTCCLPDSSGTNDLEVNIGIYPHGFSAHPRIISLTFDSSARTLTCTSIGSPATTVTWRKNGVQLIIDGSTYQMTQRVTGRRQSTYESVFTINSNNIVGTYTCLVMNVLGLSSQDLTITGVEIMAPQQPLMLGEMATLTCSTDLIVTTIRWLGPSDQVVAEDTSGQQQLYLTFNPVNESINGQQYTCIAESSGSQSTFQERIVVEVDVPSLSAEVAAIGTQHIGENYTLICSISGADNLQASIIYEWRDANNNPVSTSVQTPHTLHFDPLQLSDAGQYTCQAIISSPLLEHTLAHSVTEDISLQLPSPQVEVTHDGRSTLYAGSRLTLTCTTTLDSALQPVLSGVTVSSQWSGPGVSSGRDTVTGATGSGLVYSSTLMLDTLRTIDTGLYACSVTVNSNSAFLITTAHLAHVNITVQNPTLTASLLPNTTRLPNEAPYNSLSLTCTATAPEGVVAEKTFTWRQSLDSANLSDNADTIQIETTSAAQPVSTSVLIVTEATAGEFMYCCEVVFSDGSVASSDVTSVGITVTSPRKPNALELEKLRTINRTTSEVTVQWTVPIIAFTPETYVVHYGTNSSFLNTRSGEVQSGDDFESENLTFAVQLMELEAGTEYFFQVNSANSIGTTPSPVGSFTTQYGSSHATDSVVITGGVLGALLLLTVVISIVAIALLILRNQHVSAELALQQNTNSKRRRTVNWNEVACITTDPNEAYEMTQQSDEYEFPDMAATANHPEPIVPVMWHEKLCMKLFASDAP